MFNWIKRLWCRRFHPPKMYRSDGWKECFLCGAREPISKDLAFEMTGTFLEVTQAGQRREALRRETSPSRLEALYGKKLNDDQPAKVSGRRS